MPAPHITVEVPTPLIRFSGGRAAVPLEAASIRDAFAALRHECPELWRRLLDDSGTPRKFLILCLNGSELPRQGALDTPVHEGDRLTLLIPIAGG